VRGHLADQTALRQPCRALVLWAREACRAMLEAGFQYAIFIVLAFDQESLQVLAKRVLPAAIEIEQELEGNC
jgi:hypothetical protein